MATIAKIHFVNNDGSETRAPTATTKEIVYSFVGQPPLVISLGDFDEDVLAIAAAHGLKQKISDAYADAKGDIVIARGLAEAKVEQLRTGEWNLTGEGMARESILARALAELTGQALHECIAKLAEKTKAERAAMKKHPQLMPILARMELEKAQEALARAEANVDDTPLDF